MITAPFPNKNQGVDNAQQFIATIPNQAKDKIYTHCQQKDASRIRTPAPEWMIRRVLELATERNDRIELRSGAIAEALETEPRRHMEESLAALFHEAMVVLQEELLAFPELGRILPEFAECLLTAPTSGETLDPNELAAVIIISADAVKWVPNDIGTESIEWYLALKWQALAAMLEEAGCVK